MSRKQRNGVPPHTLAAIKDALQADHQPEPSRPTPFLGAPHIGTDWTWGSTDGRPAAHRAFGEDDDTEDTEDTE